MFDAIIQNKTPTVDIQHIEVLMGVGPPGLEPGTP